MYLSKRLRLVFYCFSAFSLCSLVADAPAQQPGGRGETNAPPARGERINETLRVGDAAPDFTLSDPLGKNETQLSSFRGKKPVVLIFGSYTLPPFRRQSGDLERLYENYQERAEFLLVYIREAHPGSVLPVLQGDQQVLIQIPQTNTVAERNTTAQQCLTALKLTLPAVVDKDDNKVNAAYAGWPDRMVVIGIDGKVAYYGKPGPGGFRPKEVEDWLQENAKPNQTPAKKARGR